MLFYTSPRFLTSTPRKTFHAFSALLYPGALVGYLRYQHNHHCATLFSLETATIVSRLNLHCVRDLTYFIMAPNPVYRPGTTNVGGPTSGRNKSRKRRSENSGNSETSPKRPKKTSDVASSSHIANENNSTTPTTQSQTTLKDTDNSSRQPHTSPNDKSATPTPQVQTACAETSKALPNKQVGHEDNSRKPTFQIATPPVQKNKLSSTVTVPDSTEFLCRIRLRPPRPPSVVNPPAHHNPVHGSPRPVITKPVDTTTAHDQPRPSLDHAPTRQIPVHDSPPQVITKPLLTTTARHDRASETGKLSYVLLSHCLLPS